MPLTKTTHHPSFIRGPPERTTFAFPPAPTSSSSSTTPLPTSGLTIVTIHPSSTFTTDLHWHDTHTEFLRITHGAALVTLNNKSFIATPSGGIDGSKTQNPLTGNENQNNFIIIPRKARHEWSRWDVPGRKGHQLTAQEEFRKTMRAQGTEEELNKLAEEDLELEEWTDPNDGAKEIFFRNIFSAMLEPRSGVLGTLVKFFQIFVVMWEGDNMLVLLDLGAGDGRGGWRAMVEELVTGIVMGFVAMVGKWVFGLSGVNKEYTPSYLMPRYVGGEEGKSEQ